ncbi:hypothetical protein IYW40_18185 [Methylocystis sp. H4A]|uniref:hypothetical protein n=1 Tax=Methylocystis sp. H4A TaxID=2785788 RepID=UPI0018C2731B|nr:hypothetical protein [Methylocystis sp. H4A]MBG0803396.1 hypothetical protein [Methylocystis sp. H4A]
MRFLEGVNSTFSMEAKLSFKHRIATAFALAAILLSGVALAEKAEERVVKEAIALFRAYGVMHPKVARDSVPRCFYAATWRWTSIPEDLSRKYFGIKALAGLVAENPSGFYEVKKIFDPEGKQPEAFCTEDQDKEEYHVLFEAFESKTKLLDKREIEASPLSDYYRRSEYSFPVFDTRFRKAAFVKFVQERQFIRSRDGKVTPLPPESFIEAVILEKRNGVWREIESVVTGQS